MAKQRYGINDAYRGTVGTVIGYEWRGKWCLRARPRMVRNPQTEKQQSNRELFKRVVQEAGRLKGFLRTGLRASALEMHLTECNLFVRRNKQWFWLDEEGILRADWEQVLVAEGPLAPVADPVVETQHAASLQAGSGGNVLAVSFRPSAEGMYADGEDEVYLAAYCPQLGEAAMSGSVWRKKGRVEMALPRCWQDKAVELWLFAVDYRGRASRSVYVGELSTLAAGEESAGGIDVLAARGAEGADDAVAVQVVLEGADGAGRGGLEGGAGRGVETDEVDAAVQATEGLDEARGVGQVVVQAAEHGVLEREAPLAAPVVVAQQGEDLVQGEGLLHGHDGQALLRHGVVEADGKVALALVEEALQAGDDAHGGDGDALGTPAKAPVGGEHTADVQDGV